MNFKSFATPKANNHITKPKLYLSSHTTTNNCFIINPLCKCQEEKHWRAGYLHFDIKHYKSFHFSVKCLVGDLWSQCLKREWHPMNVTTNPVLLYTVSFCPLCANATMSFCEFDQEFLSVSESWAGTTCPKMMSSAEETIWSPTTGSGRLCSRMMVTLSSLAGSQCGLQTLQDLMLTACACRLTATLSCTTRLINPSGTQTPPNLRVTCAVFIWQMTANWCWTGKVIRFGPLLTPKAWNKMMLLKTEYFLHFVDVNLSYQ